MKKQDKKKSIKERVGNIFTSENLAIAGLSLMAVGAAAIGISLFFPIELLALIGVSGIFFGGTLHFGALACQLYKNKNSTKTQTVTA